MKQISSILAIAIALLTGCGNNGTKNSNACENAIAEGSVHVMTFHGAQRCATCMAIEKLTEEVISDSYEGLVEDGAVVLKSVDTTNGDGVDFADKYEVISTSLILDNGKQVINLTEEAFKYARSNPDKFKKILAESIDKLL